MSKASQETLLVMLVEYIKQGEECQYSLLELKDILKTFQTGEEVRISDFILKTRLKSHHQDQLIITEMKSGSQQTLFNNTMFTL